MPSKTNILRKFIFPILFMICFQLSAQNEYTLSGYIKDAGTGEALLNASVFRKDSASIGTLTNTYGFYSITLPEDTYTFVYSYLGFNNQEFQIELNKDTRLNIELESGVLFDEIVVTAKQKDENVESTDMGRIDIPMENIKKLPSLMGEVDILKTLQLLPGVLSSTEGNTGFYVRGGGPDQNLIQLDEAVVYNTGHMLGFFSVFNSDAIKNTTLIKGSMPPMYGGRLSSVVDVQMKEGNNKHLQVQGGVGLIASRIAIEGPIVKNKSSFIISGRRTYVFDLAQPVLAETSFAGTNYYFYDLNAKANYRFSDKDHLYLSAYYGRDIFKFNSNNRGFNFLMPYGNATATLRWNHLFSDKLFMNLSAIINDYDFSFKGEQDQFTVDVFSGVRDYNGKLDFDYYHSEPHHVKFGVHFTHHRLTPNIVSAASGDETFGNDLKIKYAIEGGIYAQDDWKVNEQLKLNFGVRVSTFTHLGPYDSLTEEKTYKKGEVVQNYWGIEPRISGKYRFSKKTSVKAAIVATKQYLHLVSNSSSTLPTDVWVPSTPFVKPQQGIQYTAGIFHNFRNNDYETSLEVYYKDLKNQIDYGETNVPDPAVDVESQFVFGRGRAYGAEFFLKKRTGRFNGWIGYTLSRTERFFSEILDGDAYPTRYDRTHDVSFVMNYDLNKKWDFGLVFVYGTGNAYTPIESLFFIEQALNVNYGPRNSARIDPYHRVDLAATFTPNKRKSKNFDSSWTFSVYNVYNRFNPLFIFPTFSTNADTGEASATAYKISMFPIIPSVTWNYKWKPKNKE